MISNPIPDLELYLNAEPLDDAVYFPSPSLDGIRFALVTHASGWIGSTFRSLDIYTANGSTLLRVEGVGDFVIDPHGQMAGKAGGSTSMSRSDVDVILGPVMVCALAERDLWSLHASAVKFMEQTIAFVGETGTGKSTLAAYLSQNAEWSLVSDDILPVKGQPIGMTAWPHFPQLKLPADAQPGVRLPEHLPLNMICELVPATPDARPEVRLLSPERAVMVLLSHTAGTRLFTEEILENHLAFCAQAVEHVSVYQLIYPHSWSALPKVMKLLESLC